jgi:hypothetical protein
MRNKREGLDDELDLNLGRRGTNFVVPAPHPHSAFYSARH